MLQTLPLARLEPGSTPLVEGLTPESGDGDAIDHRADSPSMIAALAEGEACARGGFCLPVCPHSIG